MKSKVLTMTLLASSTMIGYSTTTVAEEICYSVGGSLTTENITPTIQLGNMTLTLSYDTGEVFSETGSLVGNITGGDAAIGQSVLSHTARFSQGDSLVTEGDVAQITGILDVDENSVPCAFSIYEQITDIAKGTRFFKNVTSANVVALGTVSNCPNLNENSFNLQGELCVE